MAGVLTACLSRPEGPPCFIVCGRSARAVHTRASMTTYRDAQLAIAAELCYVLCMWCTEGGRARPRGRTRAGKAGQQPARPGMR
jgi:hypothetical protein